MEVPVIRRLRNSVWLGARLAALFGTAFFLVATSQYNPPPTTGQQLCKHANQTVVFHVTGTCGPEGDVTMTSLVNDCGISVQGGGEVGLPSAGRFDTDSPTTLVADNWTLSGYLPENGTTGGTTPQADAGVFAVMRDAQAGGGPGASPDTGGTPFTVVTHGQLVERVCHTSQGSAGSVLASCYDNSASACQATLTPLR
jgi:hypothetical protein